MCCHLLALDAELTLRLKRAHKRYHIAEKALRAAEILFLYACIDLHTTRAIIKTQKALARVSPLDDESKNNQRPVG